MYKLLTLFALLWALSLAAYPNKQQATQDKETEAKVFTPEVLLADGASLVDQKVELRGTVSHVCHHGGKKCFLAGKKPGVTIQVMAGGDIEAFDKKLIGSEIAVKGVVKEHRILKDVIEKQEKAVKEKMSKEGCTEMERCSHVMSNVNQMKQWMTDNGKDYYPVYYVDATHYDAIQ